MNDYDVAVIGASVSGGTLAACLGKEGLSVALVDQGRFPRRKACGEGLSNGALAALARMGFELGPAVDSGVPYYGYRIDLGNRSFEFASGRKHLLKGVGLQRTHLDQLILDRATGYPTVVPFLETAPSGIQKIAQGYSIALSSGDEITTRQLVLADGANSKNAAMLGVPVRRKSAHLWGISFILEGCFRKVSGEVLVILKDGFEINCTPVGRNRLNVTFLTDRSQVRALQDPVVRERLLEEAMKKSYFTGRPLEKPLQVGPVSSARRPYIHESIMLLGDAAENLDPVAGMGMTHGILMAEIAADCLRARFKVVLSADRAHILYAERAEQMSRSYRGFTRLTASLLRSPARGCLLPVLSATMLPGVIRTALDGDTCGASASASLPQHFLSLVGT